MSLSFEDMISGREVPPIPFCRFCHLFRFPLSIRDCIYSRTPFFSTSPTAFCRTKPLFLPDPCVFRPSSVGAIPSILPYRPYYLPGVRKFQFGIAFRQCAVRNLGTGWKYFDSSPLPPTPPHPPFPPFVSPSTFRFSISFPLLLLSNLPCLVLIFVLVFPNFFWRRFIWWGPPLFF